MGGSTSQSNSMDQAMSIINAFVAQQQEADRQSRIRQGMSRIDGAFRGFDDTYFNHYATALNEYNMPQQEQQYRDAKNELSYRLARAGTLNSSMAINNTTDLAKQNALGRAQVLAQGDQGAANLRSRVAAEKQALIQQLYATSDPDMAANAALTSSKNLGQDQPSYSPLGQMFNVATIGAANFMNGYNTSKAYQNAFGSINGGGASQSAGRWVR